MIIMIAFVSMLAANCQLFWLLFQVTLLAGVLCTVAKCTLLHLLSIQW